MEDVEGVTETLNDIYDRVKEMFSKGQRHDIAQKKYTFLNSEQLNVLYGANGMLEFEKSIRE